MRQRGRLKKPSQVLFFTDLQPLSSSPYDSILKFPHFRQKLSSRFGNYSVFSPPLKAYPSYSSFDHPSWFLFCFPFSVSRARSMAVLVERFARRDGSEHSGSVEQEASEINGSPEIRYEMVPVSGIEAIVNSLSKWVVSILFASIVLLRHDGTALWGIIGSVSNAALSVVLKRILNQARPATTSRTDPGMPSTHAQSISFISVFAVLSVMEWLGITKVSMFLSCLILASCSYFIRLRVSQKLHTSSQVVVGAIVGSVFCIFWYTTWNSLLLEAFESSLLLQISVFLVAAALALAFATHVVLDWFRNDK
ncbi:hypothetical protein Rs2_45695 [Raphanus sativus]|uniref:Lipid phosphate phosphatase epsilon 1, chloroplastic n=1 Tax=Raphanus sativus TaxID=3726 RepID=A0A6J0NIV3_RAPSA|nr:lipid phosphate phosphatase epsilon 1, chloroplastic [Raphanus sativus]KAJ4872634.1 hypothetical protein Rs2_45695 [Raphanus sativus]